MIILLFGDADRKSCAWATLTVSQLRAVAEKNCLILLAMLITAIDYLDDGTRVSCFKQFISPLFQPSSVLFFHIHFLFPLA